MSETVINERELVAGCLRNDRRAQERFYRRYGPPALRMVTRYVTERDQALDILNQGMMKVYQKLDTFRWEGSLEGWVKRFVFRAMSDYFRSKKRPLRFIELADYDAPREATALEKLYADDIYGLVDRLPQTTKDVFWLHAVEGYNHREIGEQLAMSEGNSKWHLNKARKLLKQFLNHGPTEQRYVG